MISKQLKVSEIKNNPNNPRIIKDDKFKKLVASIQEFPEMLDAREIVVNTDNIILGGNMRYKAAKEAGLKEVPVKIVDWSEDKQRQFVIKDNVSGGEWDWDLIANEWDAEELDAWGLDTPDDWEEETEVVEDEAPEVSDEPPVSKLGEIYQLGRHRVMCADSTVKENVELLMNGEKADMVFTDPPYGMDLDTDFSGMKSKMFKGKTGGADYTKVIGDDVQYDPTHLLDLAPEVITWGADYYADKLPKGGSWYVWDKRLDESADKMWGSGFELAWSKVPHKRDLVRVKWAGIFGMEKSDTKTRVHPTQKPVELVAWFFDRIKGDNVIDLFLGSGSTLIACEQTDRTCYGMELDPKYVDVIRKRYHKFVTGNEEGWEHGTPAI